MSEISTAKQRGARIKRTVMIALFCAMAFVAVFVFRLKVMFLTFDVKDSIITLAGLIFGPLSALLISVIVPILELPTSETGLYGLLMNFISSATFSCTASLIYKYNRSIKGAVFSLVSAVFTMSAAMMIFNLIVTPFFMKTSVAQVAALIPTLLLPFNLTKAVLNASLVLVMYKPISRVMKATGIVSYTGENGSHPTEAEKTKRKITAVLVLLIGLFLILLSIFVFLNVLNGKITFFRSVE